MDDNVRASSERKRLDQSRALGRRRNRRGFGCITVSRILSFPLSHITVEPTTSGDITVANCLIFRSVSSSRDGLGYSLASRSRGLLDPHRRLGRHQLLLGSQPVTDVTPSAFLKKEFVGADRDLLVRHDCRLSGLHADRLGNQPRADSFDPVRRSWHVASQTSLRFQARWRARRENLP